MGLKAHRGTFRRQFCDNSPFNAERRYKRGPVCRGRLLFCASLSTLCKSETYSSSCHSASRSPPRLAEIESDGPINAHPAGVIEELLQKQSVRPLCIFFFFSYWGLENPTEGEAAKTSACLLYKGASRNGMMDSPQDGSFFVLRHGEHISGYVKYFSFLASCLLASTMQTTASVVLAFPFRLAATTHLVVTSKTPVLAHTQCYYCNLTQQVNCKNTHHHWDRVKTPSFSLSRRPAPAETLLEAGARSHVQLQPSVNPRDYETRAF